MTNKLKKMKFSFVTIFKREFASFFASPIAYIVMGLFLVLTGILFWQTFFINKVPSMRRLFSLLPLLLSFFIPALTMRIFAEEKKSGSIETLMTLPVTEFDVVFGKFMACFAFSVLMVLTTAVYILGILAFGKLDGGTVFCGYLGSIFLCAAFSAIGVFASSLTKNQIISFFIAFIICVVLALMGEYLVFLPAKIVNVIQFVSASYHFSAIAQGVIDTRDLVYFAVITAFFISITVELQKSERS